MLETKKLELEETFDKEIYIKGVQALKAQVAELNAKLPDGFTVYVNVEEDAYDDMDIADEDFITVEIWCDEIAEYNDLYTGLLDVCEIRDDGTSDFDIEGILAYFDELGIFDDEDIDEALKEGLDTDKGADAADADPVEDDVTESLKEGAYSGGYASGGQPEFNLDESKSIKEGIFDRFKKDKEPSGDFIGVAIWGAGKANKKYAYCTAPGGEDDTYRRIQNLTNKQKENIDYMFGFEVQPLSKATKKVGHEYRKGEEKNWFDIANSGVNESRSLKNSSNPLTRALHITGGVDSRTEAASVLQDIQKNCGIKSESEVTDILIHGKKKALALCVPSSDLAKVTKYANKKYPTLEFDVAFDFDIARLTESKSIKEGIHRIYVNGELKDEIESSNPVHEVDPIAYKYKKLNGVKEVRVEYADGTTNTMQVESKSIKEGAFSGGYAGDNSFSGGTVRGIGASTQPDHKTYLNRIKAKNPKLVDIITIKAKDLKPNMMTQAGQIKTAEVKYSDYHSKDMVYVMHTNGWDYFKELDADIEVMADPDNKSNPFTGNYKDLLKMGLQESVTRTSRKHIKGFGFTAESLAERLTGK